MKKLYLLFLLTTTVCFSQEIHNIPQLYQYHYYGAITRTTISDSNILSRVNTIIANLDGNDPATDGFHLNNLGVNSVYFSKRVLAHIQLYYYYMDQGNSGSANIEKTSLDYYFKLLLDEQCISYNTNSALECTDHGGFPANYGNDELSPDWTANPLPTALALKTFVEVRNFYDGLGQQVPFISCDEFEDRVYQAKHALYTYQQINYQYINMMGFIQIAATSMHELYDDAWSMDFLIEKLTELYNKTGPLRPFEGGDPDWQRMWEEGQQADGSWKDYGAIYVIGNNYIDNSGNQASLNECQKWHDSELDYHSVITEGLAYSYHTLEAGALKDSTRAHLLRSINHIIDYNGETEYLEHPFNELVIEDADTDLNDDYAQTRLHRTGRVTKYHRELSSTECVADPDGDGDIDYQYDKKLFGIGLIRSLIFAKNYLDNLTIEDAKKLDAIISVLTEHLVNDGGADSSLPADQLYDLTLFLNRNNLNSIQKNISKDKAIAAFKVDSSNTATIVSHKENAAITLDFNEDFYSHNQEAVDMLSGDFNGNGSDELIIAFDGGNTYRYRENSLGLMDNPIIVYSTDGGTIKSEKLAAGDFDGDGVDELIVSFSDRKIKKYSENSAGTLTEDVITPSGSTSYINPITHLAVGDFNGDSIDELILVRTSTFYSSVERYYEDENGYMVQDDIIYTNTTGVYPIGIQVGNFNEDSNDELIIALSDGNMNRYKENDTGNLVTDANENFYQNSSILPIHLEAGDFNLDGKDELVVAFNNKHISIYEEDETTAYMTLEQNFYNGNQLCRGLSAGDFDGDGVDELLVGFNTRVYRCIKNSVGVMQLRSNFSHNSGGIDDDVNLITTLRRNRIHCPGGTSSRAVNTTLNTFIETPQFNAMLVTAKDNLQLSTTNQKTENSSLEVYDITGRLLLKEKFEQTIQIDRSKLTNGLYIFIVRNGLDKKIIKMIN
ncbi:FG-GAP-like repeat-containing protein [Kordia sp.]|uniref:FG-GAP-like repeat-containing protein n=1 Tax=Kordia sp. TaxID=1965332 RepID=UPI003D281BC5